MSTDSSQLEVVPANGYDSDNDEFSLMDTYPHLVRSPEIFWGTLQNCIESACKDFKIPIVGGNSLDLHLLFKEVTSRGGLKKVIKDKKCKEVTEAFNFRTTVTNAEYVLSKYYLEMLYQLEHAFYLKAPIYTFSAKEKSLKRLIEKSQNHDTQELKPGAAVTGIIDGIFQSGYFVTMKVGSEEFKGVLYHTLETPPETQRCKKKSKSPSQGDSQRPKCQRTGYNFFVSEQYAKLKDEYTGEKGSIIKEIGNMWSNLSESDRKVYQEKGLEDAKRYNMEMLQYKSTMNSSPGEASGSVYAAASPSGEETADAASE